MIAQCPNNRIRILTPSGIRMSQPFSTDVEDHRMKAAVEQIRQCTNDARIAPGTVLDSHLHHQRFDVGFRARSAGTTAGAPIVLSSDQLSVPSQQSPRADDRCDLPKRASAEPFGSRREPAALVVRETKSATAELVAQHPILLAKVVDCLLVLLVYPAR